MSKKNSTAKKTSKSTVASDAKLFVNSHVNNVQFSEKRPGVISHIVKMLNVSEKNAVTKDEILDSLCETFADREREKMKSTLSMQVPSGLYIEKRIVVKTTTKNDKKAYYIDHIATAKAQGEWAQQKAAKNATK